MIRVRAAVAACLALSPALLGGAASGAAAGHGGGYTCGLTAVDPSATGQVSGVLTGGPWQAPADATVVVRCTVEVARPGTPPRVVARAGSDRAATAYVAPAAVAFDYVPGLDATLAVCTEVDVYRDGSPPDVYQYDADGDPGNGAQCAEAAPEGSDAARVYVAPPQADGDICVYVKHNLQPPPGDTAGGCVPWGRI